MKARFLLIPFILIGALAWLGLPASAMPGSQGGSPAAATPPVGHWERAYEEIGVGLGQPGDRSLVADSAGNLHAVYGGVALYYAHTVAGAWQHERVAAQPMTGEHASLALDSAGQPHICYRSGELPSLRHAWRMVDGWHTETVAPGVYGDAACSVAAGPGSALVIAYSSASDLMLATHDAGGWRTERAAANASPQTLSVLLDGDGRPQIAYSNTSVFYLYKDAGGWHRETAAEGSAASSLIASGGKLEIAYSRTGGISLAIRSGGGWQSESVYTAAASRCCAALAVDTAGVEHVVFYADEQMYYAHRMTVGWFITAIGKSQNVGDLAVAVAGSIPVVAECVNCRSPYLDYYRQASLNLTRLTPAAYVHETLAVTRRVGMHTLAVEDSGRIHLVFSDGASAEPWHVYEDAEGWHRERIPGARETNAAALDRSGRLHIAYVGADGLYYALRDASGWHAERVQGGKVHDAAIVLDGDGRPHPAWTDDDDGVWLASHSDSGWTAQMVAPHGYGPLYLAWDAAGRVHVGYGNRYAYLDHGTWYRAYPAPLLGAWGDALAVNAQGEAAVGMYESSYDPSYSFANLRVALRKGQEWRADYLTACGMNPCDMDLAWEPEGNLTAASMRGSPSEVYFSRRIGDAWEDELVDAATVEPGYPQVGIALRLDGAGRPVISHFNLETLGLRVLRWVAGPGTATPTPTATTTATPPPTPSITATPSVTPRPLTCLTPTPAPRATGVPPTAGTIQRQVSTCADDAYVRADTGENFYDYTYVRMGARNAGTIPYITGFLFRDVRVPKNAKITAAKLRLQPEGHYEGATVQVAIYGEERSQAVDYNPANTPLQKRERTYASVLWTLPASASGPVESPDIAPLIEAIVAMPAWQPGNNVSILIDATSATNGWLNWQAFDGQAWASAQLTLTYKSQ